MSSKGVSRIRRLAAGVLFVAPHSIMAQLPVPCGSGCTSAGGPATWVTSGQASASTLGNTLTIHQVSDKATLNWERFDVGAGYGVEFRQPSAESIALNRIYQHDPSRIAGRLQANGQIYLINQNGILFGDGAQVNVHSLVASTLPIGDDIFNEIGLAGAINVAPERPAFAVADAQTDGRVELAPNASITTEKGGRVLLIAPEVINHGSITTPEGQTVLAAAKDKVYLAASGDPDLRGLLVEVDTGGAVTNLGSILAERGNVSLVGFAVNQAGQARATTSVNVNGSIRLVARDSVSIRSAGSSGNVPDATHAGELTLTADSLTEVLPELASTETAVDNQAQPQSQVDLVGQTIHIESGARVLAPAGEVSITATEAPDSRTQSSIADSAAAGVTIAAGALIDVSGTDDVELPVNRNVIAVEARGNELRDAPLQRSGPLRGETLYVDMRQGSPLLDISGAAANLRRGVAERTTQGGTLRIESQGTVDVQRGATLDVSGGVVTYTGGEVLTTQLLDAQGRLVDISRADSAVPYLGTLGEVAVEHGKWGITERFAMAGIGRYEAGYIEGKDAGTLNISGRRMSVEGTLLAHTVTGPYQRHSPAELAGAPALRPFDQRPLSGKVEFTVNSIGSGVLPRLVFTEEAAVDRSVIDGLLVLSPALIQRSGAGRLNLDSGGRLELARDVDLRLPVDGELSLIGAQIEFNGTVNIPSGTVTGEVRPPSVGGLVDAADVALTLGPNAVLAVNGTWVNDSPTLNPERPATPVAIHGGRIVLKADGDLDLHAGSHLDVSGGAWLDATGKLRAGTGGGIDLGVSGRTNNPRRLRLDGEFDGWALEQGGTLRLRAEAFRLGGITPEGEGVVALAPEFFAQGGFNEFKLTATQGGVVLAEDTTLNLQSRNVQLDNTARRQATGSPMVNFTSVVKLPDYQRRPTNLTLVSETKQATAEALPHVAIGTGARIQADPGATLSLASDTRIYLNGVMDAPAGTIALTINATDGGYRPEQMIRLGPAGGLSADGIAFYTPDPFGRRRGEVLPAGSISLRAEHGSIITAAGSRISVDGARALFDLPTPDGLRMETLTEAGAAGTIQMEAAETMVLNGTLSGRPAAQPEGRGGQLVLALNPRQRIELREGEPGVQFPAGDRVIQVGIPADPAITAALDQLTSGEPLPAVLNGSLFVPVDAIAAGQFDGLDLVALPVGNSDEVRSGTAIRFNGDVALSLPERLSLDAPVIAASGPANVQLEAAYVAIGQTQPEYRVTATPQTGAARLDVRGELIELINDTVLQGFGAPSDTAAVTLASRGDIRLRGVKEPSNVATRVSGALRLASSLRLEAAQIYPITLSEFTVEVVGDTASKIDIAGRATVPDAPLSAGGQVRFVAPVITQGGVVRAPFGTLDFNAGEVLTLAPSSVTSVSGAGLMVPFGHIQLGSDLIFPLTPGMTRVEAQSPVKRVNLLAPTIDITAGALIDVSAGGNLGAVEFVPGPGGSRDILLAGASDGAFAILPQLESPFAPYDPIEFAPSGLRVGDTVTVAAGSAIPAGEYAMLPARYALFGGWLLRPAESGEGLVPGQALTLPDGSQRVVGKRSVAGTSAADSRGSAYIVESGAQVRQRAEYLEADLNAFFADTVSELPRDAGTLSIGAGVALSLAGNLVAERAALGHGSRVDIAAENLAVVIAPRGASDVIELTAAELNRFGADSLLIGGTRRTVLEGVELDVVARTLVVESGVELTGPEWLLTATENLTLEENTALTARGDAAVGGETLVIGSRVSDGTRVPADFALARTSVGQGVVLQGEATPPGLTGSLVVAAQSRIEAPGSVTLEASKGFRLDGTVASGGDVALGARRISLGDEVTAVTKGLSLSNAALARLSGSQLTLRSDEAIDILGAVQGQFTRLTLDTPGLRAATSGTRGTLEANTLELVNSSTNRLLPVGLPPDETGAGELAVTSQTIRFDGGDFAVIGLDRLALDASGDFLFAGAGSVTTTGDLAIRTSRVSGADGAVAELTAAGQLTMGSLSTAASAGTDASGEFGLAAQLGMHGQTVSLGGRFELPSGQLRINAADTVSVAADSVLNLAGVDRVFADLSVGTPGGQLAAVVGTGDIVIGANAHLDVSGAPSASSAGTVTLVAPAGAVSVAPTATLRGQATVARGGSLIVDAARLPNFTELNTVLNTGGFSDRRYLRLRTGDLTVAAGVTLRAADLELTADQGAVRVAGTLDSSTARGGRVVVNAQQGISITDNARVLAAATGDIRGGRVELATRQGTVALSPGSVIDVSGVDESGAAVASGRVRLTTPQAPSDVPLLGALFDGARRIEWEQLKQYDVSTSGIVDDALAGVIQADVAVLMNGAAALKAQVGMADVDAFHVIPGVEVISDGDLRVVVTTPGADGRPRWDLASWRVGNEVGRLTLRAARNLTLEASMSDGFAVRPVVPLVPEQPTEKERLLAGESWSLALVAGADIKSANIMGTAAGAGHLELQPGVALRTGTGDIRVATSGDVRLGDTHSVIYTAGRDGGPGDIVKALPELGGPLVEALLVGFGGENVDNFNSSAYFPLAGGDIRLDVGGNLTGVKQDQLISEWLPHIGGPSNTFGAVPGYWAIRYDRFRQGIGALGGGDIVANLGGELRNVSFAIPTTGKAVGDVRAVGDVSSVQFLPGDHTTEINGGGVLRLDVAGDVTNSLILVGRGSGDIRVGGALQAEERDTLGPVIAVGDGRIELTAMRDVLLETVLNPTLLIPKYGDRPFGADELTSVFSTYSDDSQVIVNSLAGNVLLRNTAKDRIEELDQQFGLRFSGQQALALQIYPGTLRVHSFAGDIESGGFAVSYPTPQGTLEFMAHGSITTGGIEFKQSDADRTLLPTSQAPWTLAFIEDITQSPFARNFVTDQHGPVPVHLGDTAANYFVAQTGNLYDARLVLAKSSRLSAGWDVDTVTLRIQHANANDISEINAGRDIIQPTQRTPTGAFAYAQNEQLFEVSGPGRIDLLAGDSIDLGAAPGILTLGDTANPALADEGADVTLMAGFTHAADWDTFAARYLTEGDSIYADKLAQFLLSRTTDPNLSAAENYSRLPLTQRRDFLIDLFFTELRESGIAATAGSGDYARGFAAIETLFPATQAYNGNLSLLLSRITTLDGGDINVFVPGGFVNGGVASASVIDKKPDELGIVTARAGSINAFVDGDFRVNQSRVFALNGDLLMWSSRGDIDAGRGAKTAIAAPPPLVSFDAEGNVIVEFPPVVAGSGLLGKNAYLFAPQGVIDAGDAGIRVAGNLTLGATRVIGADNIDVGGIAVGVPVADASLAAGLTGVGNVAAGVSKDAETALASNAGDASNASATPLADDALSFLDVVVEGFGEVDDDATN